MNRIENVSCYYHALISSHFRFEPIQKHTKPFLFIVPAKYGIHTPSAEINHVCPAQVEVLRGEKVLIRHWAAEEAYVIGLLQSEGIEWLVLEVALYTRIQDHSLPAKTAHVPTETMDTPDASSTRSGGLKSHRWSISHAHCTTCTAPARASASRSPASRRLGRG